MVSGASRSALNAVTGIVGVSSTSYDVKKLAHASVNRPRASCASR